jgi:hypothetical protein
VSRVIKAIDARCAGAWQAGDPPNAASDFDGDLQ